MVDFLPHNTDLFLSLKVNSVWAGLGYYRRAKMLHEGAKKVVEVHGGCLPSTAKELKEIPGIGPYTAGSKDKATPSPPLSPPTKEKKRGEILLSARSKTANPVLEKEGQKGESQSSFSSFFARIKGRKEIAYAACVLFFCSSRRHTSIHPSLSSARVRGLEGDRSIRFSVGIVHALYVGIADWIMTVSTPAPG